MTYPDIPLPGGEANIYGHFIQHWHEKDGERVPNPFPNPHGDVDLTVDENCGWEGDPEPSYTPTDTPTETESPEPTSTEAEPTPTKTEPTPTKTEPAPTKTTFTPTAAAPVEDKDSLPPTGEASPVAIAMTAGLLAAGTALLFVRRRLVNSGAWVVTESSE